MYTLKVLLLNSYKEALFQLAEAIENKDGYTASHCQRIKDISLKMGTYLGLSKERLERLEFGSYLHDLGKTKIDTAIIQKPSRLTEEEYEQMKLHTIYGAEMIRSFEDSSLEEIALMIEQHHERVDGKGYPFQLSDKSILLESQIIAVADSYDAMTSQRSYNRVKSKKDAIDELINCIGTHYRKDVVFAFISISDDV